MIEVRNVLEIKERKINSSFTNLNLKFLNIK